MSLHRELISSHRMASVRVFHDVLRVFNYVLLVVHDVLLCFTMFSDSSNDRHCRQPIASRITTTAQKSAITSQRLAISAQK